MTMPEPTVRSQGRSDPSVERTRAVTGLVAVIVADVAVAIAAILGIVYASRGTGETAQIAAILSSGFTAIGTTTTAYFGIKSISNTANNLAGPPTGVPVDVPTGSPVPPTSPVSPPPAPSPAAP